MTRIKDLPTFETLDPTNWIAVDSNSDEEASGKASPATLSAFVNSDLSPLLSIVEGTGITVSGDPQNPTITADQGGGDMYTDIYDPQNISNDAFSRENHTGEQPISATTGLQDALDVPVDEQKLTRRLSARVGGLFDTVADLQSDTTLTYSNVSSGDIVEVQGFRYEVVASDAPAFDRVTAPNGYNLETAGGVRLRVRRQEGNILQPEQWNAIGDGVADDTALVQQCVDLAESLPNSIVNLLPNGIGYGISDTIKFGQGTYNTVFYGCGQTSGGRESFTFQKIANVVAWEVVHNSTAQPTIIDISVKGRGNTDPTTNDPLIESTPGALIHHRCVVIRPSFYGLGGFAGLENEINTNGYALGIYSKLEGSSGNCNYAVVDDVVSSFANGDVVYIGHDAAAPHNQNAMRVTVRNSYGAANGYVINDEDGFNNEFHVLHVNEAQLPALGIFRLNDIMNYASVTYIETNFPGVGVSFGDTSEGGDGAGRINVVEFLNGVGAVASLYDTIYNNRVIDLRRGTEFVGTNDQSAQRGVVGPGGFLVDRLKAGTGWADAYVNSIVRIGSVGATGGLPTGVTIRGAGTSNRELMRFSNDNGTVGGIAVAGTSTAFLTSSDETLKIDDGLLSFEQARAILDLIVFHNFRWKNSNEAAHGVFAQELYKIYPVAVIRGGWHDPETGEMLDEDNGTEYRPWGVDYSKLVPILGASLQGVLVRQDDFQARLLALEKLNS